MFGRNRRRVESPQPPQPVCGCQHHLSFHDPETGRCGFTQPVYTSNYEVVVNASGNPVLDAYRDVQKVKKTSYEGEHQCGCQRYIGPEPLTAYYAPEIVP